MSTPFFQKEYRRHTNYFIEHMPQYCKTTSSKMKETFTHIRSYWKEKEYKKCKLEWKQIQTFISKEYTPYQCGRCNTYWNCVSFINDHENICPKCDTHCQPFLCNPVNYDSVLKYIDSKYHHYLINDE
jgi:hypothetical protein